MNYKSLTKHTSVFAAALVVAGVLFTNPAQSATVVGFVNVRLVGGGLFSLIANPLNATNNSLTNLFSTAQDGDTIFTWDASIQDLSPALYVYSSFAGRWDGNRALKPGEGFFYLNAGGNRTNTFVGEVIQGPYTNPVPIIGSASFNSIAAHVPIGGSFTNAIGGIVPRDGDQVFIWDVPSQDFAPGIPTYSTFAQKWDITSVTVAPGIGFFYLGAGPNQNLWIRNYTVP